MTTEFNKMLRKSNQQGIKTGEKRGLKKGLDLGRRETAINMIADGTIPLEKIAKYSGLSLKEVESLKEESPAYK